MTAMLSVSTIPGARAQHHGQRQQAQAQAQARRSGRAAGIRSRRTASNQRLQKSTSPRPGEGDGATRPFGRGRRATGEHARCWLLSDTELSQDHADRSLFGASATRRAHRNSCFSRDIPERPPPARGSVKVRPCRLHAGIISSRRFSDLVQARASPRCLHGPCARRLAVIPADAPPQPPPRASITGRTGARETAS